MIAEWKLPPFGCYVDGPHSSVFVTDKAEVEAHIKAMCEATGDDPDDYTSTQLYAIGWMGPAAEIPDEGPRYVLTDAGRKQLAGEK